MINPHMLCSRWKLTSVICLVFQLVLSPVNAQDVKLLCDFEGETVKQEWEIIRGTAGLVSEGATHGPTALEIQFDPESDSYGAYLFWQRVQGDWSGYDAAVLDIWNPNPDPIPAYVLIADRAWQDKGSNYWNRHNAQTTLPPGQSQWMIATARMLVPLGCCGPWSFVGRRPCNRAKRVERLAMIA